MIPVGKNNSQLMESLGEHKASLQTLHKAHQWYSLLIDPVKKKDLLALASYEGLIL